VTSQIPQKFADPRIRETFQEVAENQASKMLRDQIQPAVDRFRADLPKEYQVVSEEIEPLKLQNNLPVLAYESISQDDREAFEEIRRIAQMAREKTALKNSAIREIEMITSQMYGSYLSSDRLLGWSAYNLSKLFSEISTDQLILSLSDSDLKVRGRAAGHWVIDQKKEFRIASYKWHVPTRVLGLLVMH
jgi:hypothetical protein